MTVVLYRIDDRLIHGQVVLGWGRPLDAEFMVLVDDEIAASPWEQDLYRMALPPGVEVMFAGVEEAQRMLPTWERDSRRGFVITGAIAPMAALVRADGAVHPREVNLGGVHQRAGRTARLSYVYLDPAEVEELKALAAAGVTITAQDVPTTQPVSLKALLGE